MKILITGGAGFIGSHTSVEFLNKGHDVIILDNLSNSNINVINNIPLICKLKPIFVLGDVRDEPLVEQLMIKHKPDMVVHFAALKSVSDSVIDPITYYDVNLGGLKNILIGMEKTNCKKLIFSSSATVYDLSTDGLIQESHDTKPINPYGRSKLFSEMIVEDWVNANHGNMACSLRYFNPVGAHPSALIGEQPSNTATNLMPLICAAANGDLPSLKLFGNDYDTRDGSGERDYLHVCDLAEAHVVVAEKISGMNRYQVLNIGTGVGTTVLELINNFELVNDLKIKIELAPRRLGDFGSVVANPSLSQEVLNFYCKRSLNSMCRDSWKSYKIMRSNPQHG